MRDRRDIRPPHCDGRARVGGLRLALTILVGIALVAAPGAQAWSSLPACCRSECLGDACPLRGAHTDNAGNAALDDSEAVDPQTAPSCHQAPGAAAPSHASDVELASEQAPHPHEHVAPAHVHHVASSGIVAGEASWPVPAVVATSLRCPASAELAPAPLVVSLALHERPIGAEIVAAVRAPARFVAGLRVDPSVSPRGPPRFFSIS